jgi:Co/Zn/Cd efflux system component
MRALCAFLHHPHIQGFPIIVATVVGLTVNFSGMRLLNEGKGGKGHSHGLYEHASVVSEEK